MISPDDITEETCLERLRDEGEPLQFFAFFGQRDELKAAGHAKLKRCLEALKAKGLITYSQSDHGYTLTEGDNGEPESGSVAELAEQPETEARTLENACEIILGAIRASDAGLTSPKVAAVDPKGISKTLATAALLKLEGDGQIQRSTHEGPTVWTVPLRISHHEKPAQEREPFSLAAPDPNKLAEQVAELRDRYLVDRCDLEVLNAIDRALEAVGEGVKMQPARDALHGARALHVRQHCDAEVLSKLDDAEMALAWLGRQLEAL